jgi:hypothetical protein
MTNQDAQSLLDSIEESTLLLPEEYQDALLGIGTQFNTTIAVYSKSKTIQCLVNQGMDEEEAMEYFNFNIGGAYVGEQTPIFLED